MFNNVFSFQGRLNRISFVSSSIILLISTIMLFFLLTIILWEKNQAISFICYVFVAFNFYRFKLSLMVRRAQDFGRKGQDSYLVSVSVAADSIVFFISLIVLLFKGYHMDYLIYTIYIFAIIISILCLISLAIIKGNDGENNFGKQQIQFFKKESH